MSRIILAMFLLTAGGIAQAAPSAEPDVADKARQRIYDGGIDEQPLQVQTSLYNPKMEAEKIGEGESAPTGVTTTIDEAPPEE